MHIIITLSSFLVCWFKQFQVINAESIPTDDSNRTVNFGSVKREPLNSAGNDKITWWRAAKTEVQFVVAIVFCFF